MASTTTAMAEVATDVTVAITTLVEKTPRKFPPPCWTQDETLALIDAYRERWYALRRGYLRTADWDAVAAAVSQRCPHVSPPKTSAQCRHKMEKLRQRYRAEKQRSLAFPTGRFFSSWFFFENMDALENESSPPTAGSNQDSSGSGFRLKTFLDQNILKLKVNPKKFDEQLESKVNFEATQNDGKLSSSYGSKVLNNTYNSYVDMSSDKEDDDDDVNFGGMYRLQNRQDNLVVENSAKNSRNLFGSVKNGFDVGHEGSKGFDVGNGYVMLPPGMRAKRYGKGDGRMSSGFDGERGGEHNGSDSDNRLWEKVAQDRNVVHQNPRGKHAGSVDGSVDSRGLNGYSNLTRSGVDSVKRVRDPVEEMVSSIKMLGEGFMKVEKMKMDMAREIEKMRMKMEMKRNELILESQKQIVDAFLKGLMEMKNKKVKMTAAPEP